MAALTDAAVLSHLRSLQPFPSPLMRPPQGALFLQLPEERGTVAMATIRGLISRGLIEEIDRARAPRGYLQQTFDLTEDGRDLLELAEEEVGA